LVDDRLAAAINGCVRGRTPWPLLVLGPPGVGKTFALLSVCDSFYRSVYTTPGDHHREATLADRGDLYRGGYKVWASDFWDRYDEASVVAVDEFGLRSEITDSHYENVKRLLDVREYRAAIYASNVSPEKLASIYDERILSRLACGTVVTVNGEDRRFQR
jgi:DNA replication protein DnaC